MEKEWDGAKEILENSIRYIFRHSYTLSDGDVLVGLLHYFNNEGASFYFPRW